MKLQNDINRKFAVKQAEIDELLVKSHVHTAMLGEESLDERIGQAKRASPGKRG